MKRIVVLGSTGSIGESTLDVIRMHPDRFRVVGLSTGFNNRLLEHQAEEFGVKLLGAASPSFPVSSGFFSDPLATIWQPPKIA